MANINGGLSGAGQGAAAGSAFGPWGALAGGLIGGATGLMSDSPADIAKRAGRDYKNAVNTATNEYSAQANQILSPLANLANRADYTGDFDSYLSALRSSNPSQYNVTAGTLKAENPLDNVSSFLDPSLKYQKEQATKSVQESAAGQGGLFSGAAGQAISNETRKISETGWNDAYNKANAAAQRQNDLVSQQQALNLSAASQNLQNAQTGLSNLGTAYNTSVSPLQGLMDAQLGIAGTQYNTKTGVAGSTYQQNLAAANSQESPLSGLTSLVGTAGKLWGNK